MQSKYRFPFILLSNFELKKQTLQMADLSLTKFPCWILGSCLILASSMIPGRCFLYFTLNFHAVATLSYDFERDDTLTFLADVLVSLLSVQSRSARSPWLPMLLIECRVMNTCIYVPIDLLNSCFFFIQFFRGLHFGLHSAHVLLDKASSFLFFLL